MTPRKTRQKPPRGPSQSQSTFQNQVLASDYESEAPGESYNAPLVTRTNTDLNLSVLRRYKPTVNNILSIAASAVIYIYLETGWDRSGIEGTLFVCDTTPSPLTNQPGYCIVVLNRRGLDNLILDIGDLEDVEVTQEYLILSYLEGGERKVLGVYMHEDKHDTREINSRLVKGCWENLTGVSERERDRLPGDEGLGVGMEEALVGTGSMGYAGPGRQLDLNQLFQAQRPR